MRRILPLLVLVAVAGCRPKSPVLGGSLDDLSSLEGRMVEGTPPPSFMGGKAEAQAIARIVLAGRSCETLKYQGLAWIELIFADGRRQSIGVTRPKPIILIGDDAYTVDMAALLAVLGRCSTAPSK